MASGIIHSFTFTPGGAGTLALTISGQAQGVSGGDWGSAYYLQAYVDQGTPEYGDLVRASSARLPFALTYQTTVVGGVEVEVGLWGEISGAVSLACYDIKIDAQVIKR